MNLSKPLYNTEKFSKLESNLFSRSITSEIADMKKMLKKAGFFFNVSFVCPFSFFDLLNRSGTPSVTIDVRFFNFFS
jgi:hypothetical protein